MAKRRGNGNVHTHHFIGEYLPDAMFLQQAHIKESTARRLEKSIVLRLLFAVFYPSLNPFLKMLTSGDPGVVRDYHIKDMNACGIDFSTVLLMDYSLSAPKSADHEKLSDYRVIMKNTAESCAREPFRFFLFHYFDPRYMVMADAAIGKQDYCINNRVFPNTTFAIRLLLDAFYQYGCVGVKMYPPLGYHPVPEENMDPGNLIRVLDQELNPKERELTAFNLEFLYRFIQEHGLPLMTHCGPGGSYNVVVADALKGRHVWRFTNPLNFEKVVKMYPGCRFRICFGHMGGKPHKLEECDMARIWKEKILYLIRSYPGVFYADQSYDISNFLGFKEKKWNTRMLTACVEDTEAMLSDLEVGRSLLFGTDWPLGYHQFRETDYTLVYRSGLSPQNAERYFSSNIADFLFGPDRIIPPSHISYLQFQNQQSLPVPDWVDTETVNGRTTYKLL